MKNLLKIVFALALTLTSLSWAGINEMEIRICDEGCYTSFNPHSYVYGYVDPSLNISRKVQDLQESAHIGPYVYMGFWTTDILKKTTSDNEDLNVITDLIFVNVGETTNPSETITRNGITYKRFKNFKDENGNTLNVDLHANKVSKHHLHLYYTTQNIDGKTVVDLIATKNMTPISNNYTVISNMNLNSDTKGESNTIYLQMRRSEMPTVTYDYNISTNSYYYPQGFNSSSAIYTDYLSFNGNQQNLVEKGRWSNSNIAGEQYKVGNGNWTNKIPTAKDAGTYTIYTKLKSNSLRHLDYDLTLTTVIHKLNSREYLGCSFKLNDIEEAPFEFYSGDEITISNWNDICNSTSQTFKLYHNNTYTTLSSTNKTEALKSGSYFFHVSFNETANCESITTSFANVTVKKSKLIFDSDGGSAVATIEGETGDPYTKPSNPTKTGHQFTGWEPSLPSTIQRGTNTYKAEWSINQYTITFDAHGGKFSDGSTTKKITQNYNTPVTAPAVPTKTDSAFVGWDKTVPSSMPDYNMTITAKWKYNRYKVTLPTGMEFYQCTPASDGTFLNGSTVQFKVKSDYTTWSDVTSNGSVITPSNDIYSVKVNSAAITINARMAEVHGGIQIAVDKSKAIIDGTIDVTSEVKTAVQVDAVEFTRTFNRDKTTTLVIPFSIDMEYVWGGIFCKFTGMMQKGGTTKVRMLFVNTIVQANTPYVYIPLNETLSIKQPAGQKIEIKTSEGNVSDGDWEFRGTYSPRTWQEDDADIGRCYRFIGSGEDIDGVAGTFKKTGPGAYIHPMMAYLTKNQPQALKRSNALSTQALSKAQESLPDELDVEIVNEEEKTLAIGKLNTVTGKFQIDRWFDLNGKLLKGKPTSKGVYYNNGKKVLVK